MQIVWHIHDNLDQGPGTMKSPHPNVKVSIVNHTCLPTCLLSDATALNIILQTSMIKGSEAKTRILILCSSFIKIYEWYFLEK
jgi:hypothetical protein